MYKGEVGGQIGIHRGIETSLICSIEIVVCVKMEVGRCRGVV